MLLICSFSLPEAVVVVYDHHSNKLMQNVLTMYQR